MINMLGKITPKEFDKGKKLRIRIRTIIEDSHAFTTSTVVDNLVSLITYIP